MFPGKIIWLMVACAMQAGCANLNKPNPFERKHYGDHENGIGYSQVVRVGKTLYISGVVSTAPTFVEQLKEDYQTITKMLNDYGLDTSAIARETIYTRDMVALKNAIPIRKAFFEEDAYPSSSWVQIDQLFMPENLVEIEVEAHLP